VLKQNIGANVHVMFRFRVPLYSAVLCGELVWLWSCDHYIWQLLRGYSINEPGFGYVVNVDSDSHGELNATVTQYYDVTVVCLCCFLSYFAHFDYQDAVCLQQLLWMSFLNIFIIISTHHRCHIASEIGFN